jgi:glycosyltransferase involved in cell wall biosynthesis
LRVYLVFPLRVKVKKLCIVATIPAIVNSFLRGHIEAAAQKYDVTVVCNSTDVHLIQGLSARIVLFPILRRPSLRNDLVALFLLIKLFWRERFDIVHSHFPKSGFLGMTAAWLTKVPIRIHTFHGEVWATRDGWRRSTLKAFDRIVACMATQVLTVSASQQRFLVREGILSQRQSRVIGAGSICGVDPRRFQPDLNIRRRTREELGIDNHTRLILFMGRLTRDKGVLDLTEAFLAISRQRPDVALLLVGTQEDILFSRLQEMCGVYGKRVHYLNFTSVPEHYMAAADVFCLPSYREGFGMTIIESAACAVPAVASRINGIVDAVSDGETGLLFTPTNVAELTKALLALISDDLLRQRMGSLARSRAVALFAADKITAEVLAFYDSLSEKL